MTKTEIKHLFGKIFDISIVVFVFSIVFVFGWYLIVNSDWKVDRVSLAAVLEKRGGTITSDGETIPLDYLTRNFYFKLTSYNFHTKAISKKQFPESEDSIVINVDNCRIVINSALNGYALNISWFDGERTRSYTVNTGMKFSTCKTQFFSSKIAYENLKKKI